MAKRILALLLAAALLLLSVGCSGGKDPEKDPEKDPDEGDSEVQTPAVLSKMELLETEKAYADAHHSSEAVLPLGYEPKKTVDPSTMKGKVLCGYQGWFGTSDDGCKVRGWQHWSGGFPHENPYGETVSFELFPDVSEYPASCLTNIGYMKPGNGNPAQLFSSYKQETVDLHFQWMQQYGIDGVALQRFGGEACGGRAEHFNTVAGHVKNAAEKYGRTFYLCYDLSGTCWNGWVEDIENDFADVIEGKLGLTSSPQYLHEDGKPVVELWGIGVSGNYRSTPEDSIRIIEWFKERGFYVIGGTPSGWRNNNRDALPNFTEVYRHLDMISPWTVGRYNNPSNAAGHYKNLIKPDLEATAERGQKFMPVIYSGFAWSKWNGGPQNSIPRNCGEFLWSQMKLCSENDVYCVYVAMFDEYDEATAIMKAADSSYAIPRRSYFLTHSADGSYVSEDYYLRVVGKFTADFAAGRKLSAKPELPLTPGPHWLRTGFENGMDAMPKMLRFEADGNLSNVECKITKEETAPLHESVLLLKGNAPANGFYRRQFFEMVPVQVTENTKFRYIKKSEGDEGSRAVLDLLFSDGTRLSDTGITDQRGLHLCDPYLLVEPPVTAPDGTVSEPMKRSIVWDDFRYNVGSVCKGKTIVGIEVLYKGSAEGGAVEAYFDDIIISDDEISDAPLTTPIKVEPLVKPKK